MAGNLTGGKKARATNRKKYGDNFYAAIGALGGAASRTGGFGSDKVGADGLTGKERAKVASAKGHKSNKLKKGNENVN